jgi:putative two-component system response regulator
MGATILLAVAHDEARTAWNELLTSQGYKIIGIGSGERIADLCLHLRPDLVLVEACLPDISGFEVCRRLKQDSKNRLTPVVVIASFLDDSDASYARDAGADDFWDAHPSRWEALTRIQSLLQLKSYIDEQGEAVIFSLARSIEARDSYTHGHCERLSRFAVKLGSRIGLSPDDLNALRVAGIVHDIGKVIVPDAILMKPGRLTFEEMKIIEQHPVAGERICSPLKSLRRVLPMIRHHHERMDGSGYPDGLRGNKIPLGARTLQIVDIFDALTTDRPYRRALSLQEALRTMYEEAERGWLDAELVSAFATTAAVVKPSWTLEFGETYQRAQAI